MEAFNHSHDFAQAFFLFKASSFFNNLLINVILQNKSQKTKVDRNLLPQEISLPLGDFIGVGIVIIIEILMQGSTIDPSRHIMCLMGTPKLIEKHVFKH
jgi:hypothetical protein